MESWLLLSIVAFVVVLLITPLSIRLATRLDFLDYPRGHKSHKQPVPLLGGLAIFAGLSCTLGAALVLGWTGASQALLGFYLCCACILVLGILDDRFGLTPVRKFMGQNAVALLFLIFYDPGLTGFGFPLGFLVLMFWMVGLINALNFLDNMDGLCSGISLVASSAFALLALLEGKIELLIISLGLAGSYLAFLKYNLAPARIFLGDAGSMLSGFSLAAMGMLFVSEIRTQYAVIVPLLILSYPIFDISFVTFTRLKQGKKFYQGGLDHSSHRLVYLGVTSQKAVRGILSISLFLAITGILTYYFFDSPVKILIPLSVAFTLTLFGIHLHRNFLNFKEKLLLIGLDMLVVNFSFALLWRAKFTNFTGEYSCEKNSRLSPRPS
jgi:UDP-GlcNAc:undecaprenyl-phosphate GlcNAc-1-phosphate transferase